jgi:hypothetical protein
MTAELLAGGHTILPYFRGCPPCGPEYGGSAMTDIPPEADALEQRTEVTPEEDLDRLTSDPEAPEADALEQAQIVPAGDEEDMRG